MQTMIEHNQKYYISINRGKSQPQPSTQATSSDQLLSRDISYSITKITPLGNKHHNSAVSSMSKIKCNKALREYLISQKKYKALPNYLESARMQYQMQKQLAEGHHVQIPKSQDYLDKLIDRRCQKIKKNNADNMLPRIYSRRVPTQNKENEEIPSLFVREAPIKTGSARGSIVKSLIQEQKTTQKANTVEKTPKTILLNQNIKFCGGYMKSLLEDEKKCNKDSRSKSPSNSQDISKLYKQFKSLTCPSAMGLKSIKIVSLKGSSAQIDNPLEKDPFYQQYIRKESLEFTNRFVSSFSCHSFTFDNYLLYRRLFVKREATMPEVIDFVHQFFCCQTNNEPYIEIREIKKIIEVLCQNLQTFPEIKQYEGSLQSSLLKTLLGRQSFCGLDNHLLKKSDLKQALSLNPDLVEIVYILMFTQNPHSIPR